MVGYSRQMGADEEGTHERLKAHLREHPNLEVRKAASSVFSNSEAIVIGPRGRGKLDLQYAT